MASPPIRFPCYMGINIPTKEELIANKPEFRDLAKYIGKMLFFKVFSIHGPRTVYVEIRRGRKVFSEKLYSALCELLLLLISLFKR